MVSEPSRPNSIAPHRAQSIACSALMFVCLVLFPPSTSCLSFLNSFSHSLLLSTARGREWPPWTAAPSPSLFPLPQGRQGKLVSQAPKLPQLTGSLCPKPQCRHRQPPGLQARFQANQDTTGREHPEVEGLGCFSSSVGLSVPPPPPTLGGTEPGPPGPATPGCS